MRALRLLYLCVNSFVWVQIMHLFIALILTNDDSAALFSNVNASGIHQEQHQQQEQQPRPSLRQRLAKFDLHTFLKEKLLEPNIQQIYGEQWKSKCNNSVFSSLLSLAPRTHILCASGVIACETNKLKMEFLICYVYGHRNHCQPTIFPLRTLHLHCKEIKFNQIQSNAKLKSISSSACVVGFTYYVYFVFSLHLFCLAVVGIVLHRPVIKFFFMLPIWHSLSVCHLTNEIFSCCSISRCAHTSTISTYKWTTIAVFNVFHWKINTNKMFFVISNTK